MQAFIAITGETGAGKSVFISSLQYISGSTGKGQFKNPKGDAEKSSGGSGGDFIEVTLQDLQDLPSEKDLYQDNSKVKENTSKRTKIARAASANSKMKSTSLCQVNGEKTVRCASYAT